MTSIRPVALALCLTFVSWASLGRGALAQSRPARPSATARSVAPVGPQVQEQHTTLLLRQQWLRQHEDDRQRIRIAGSITGLVLGTGLAVGSVFGIAHDGRPFRGMGVVGMLIALPTLVLSTILLQRRVSKRREIQRQIVEHQLRFSFNAPLSVQF
ncbi:MAG: hypothetical protein JWN04_6234 [Myxococcaceae bacterium]|nr:hypothetical protein [Myxococcaceae bacterium]